MQTSAGASWLVQRQIVFALHAENCPDLLIDSPIPAKAGGHGPKCRFRKKAGLPPSWARRGGDRSIALGALSPWSTLPLSCSNLDTAPHTRLETALLTTDQKEHSPSHDSLAFCGRSWRHFY